MYVVLTIIVKDVILPFYFPKEDKIKWAFEKTLGKGEHGEVKLFKNAEENSYVAVKVANYSIRAQLEMYILGNLNHR